MEQTAAGLCSSKHFLLLIPDDIIVNCNNIMQLCALESILFCPSKMKLLECMKGKSIN